MPTNTKDDLIITSLETIDAFDMNDQFLWTLDELTQATIQNTEDTEDVTGKHGRLLTSLKRGKSASVTGTNGVISAGMMATQVGSDVKAASNMKVRVTEFITVDTDANTGNFTSNVLTLSNSGVFAVALQNNDSTFTDFTKTTETTVGSNQYKVSDSGITFNASDITAGAVLKIVYEKTIEGTRVTNVADDNHTGATIKLYINAFAEDRCGNIFKVQFYFPRAMFSGSFDIDMGGSQVTHGFEAKALPGGCGALANKGMLWTYTVFGDAA